MIRVVFINILRQTVQSGWILGILLIDHYIDRYIIYILHLHNFFHAVASKFISKFLKLWINKACVYAIVNKRVTLTNLNVLLSVFIHCFWTLSEKAKVAN